MSGKDAPTSNPSSPPQPLFVGRRGGQTVTFVCSRDGCFHICYGGACISVWAADELEIALAAYLEFVERPGQTAEAADEVRRLTPQAPPPALWPELRAAPGIVDRERPPGDEASSAA